jgi:hypothetical protein
VPRYATDDLRMKDSVSQTFPRAGTLKYISAYHATPNHTFSVKMRIRHVGYAERTVHVSVLKHSVAL